MKSSRIGESRCSKNGRLFIELKSKWLCKFSAGGAISWLVAETFRMQRQGDVHLLLQCGCHCDRKARNAHWFQKRSRMCFTVSHIFIQIDSISQLLAFGRRLVFHSSHWRPYFHSGTELIELMCVKIIIKNSGEYGTRRENSTNKYQPHLCVVVAVVSAVVVAVFLSNLSLIHSIYLLIFRFCLFLLAVTVGGRVGKGKR